MSEFRRVWQKAQSSYIIESVGSTVFGAWSILRPEARISLCLLLWVDSFFIHNASMTLGMAKSVGLSTTLSQTEISLTIGGLPRKVLQTFMVPKGWMNDFSDPHEFLITSRPIYLYTVYWHKILYIHDSQLMHPNDFVDTFFYFSATVFTEVLFWDFKWNVSTVGRIAMIFGKDNLDLLTFHWVPIIRSIFNLSNTLVYEQISSKLMTFQSSPVVVVNEN